MGCCIQERSQQVASEMLLGCQHRLSTSPAIEIQSPLGEIYTVDDDQVSDDLFLLWKKQAIVLAKESKETFWISAAVVEDVASDTNDVLCPLEVLAWKILQFYNQKYFADSSNCGFLGAEWWVQVKPVATSTANDTEPASEAGAAIDLHYDKDEALAETFQLGRFPTLSTVTYLSRHASIAAPPTVILERRYEDSATTSGIPRMLISHPVPRKHLVFDGRLLHGAPGNAALRLEPNMGRGTSLHSDDALRVTFLVNLWHDHQPAQVQPLPPSLRRTLSQVAQTNEQAATSRADVIDDRTGTFLRPTATTAELRLLPDESMTIEQREQERIELAFVGGSATWANNDDEEDEGIAVVSLYPPQQDEDTCLVEWAPEIEAMVEYGYDEDEEDVDDCGDDAESTTE